MGDAVCATLFIIGASLLLAGILSGLAHIIGEGAVMCILIGCITLGIVAAIKGD